MKRAIWVTTEPKSKLEKRLLILYELGFSVEVASSLKDLFVLCQENRPSFILLSELQSLEETARAIKDLSKNHDTKGAKFIFITASHHQKHLEQCAFYAFRGILSMDLPDSAWKEHMSFFSGSNKDPMPFFSARLTLRHICELMFPARVVWMSKDKLRIETAVRLAAHERILLKGPICESLGLAHLELTVLRVSRTHLVHRFSFGYELDWSSFSISEKQKLFQKLSGSQKIKPRPIRLFSIIKSHSLRGAVARLVDDDRFEITSALKISNMIDEPQFITPDVILIEDFFLNEKYFDKLKLMTEKTQASTKIIIIAAQSKLGALEAFIKQTPHLKVEVIDNSILEGADFKEKLLSEYKDVFQSDERYFDRSDEITCHQIVTKGHLRSVHPLHLSVSSLHGIAPYSYFQVSSPLLEKAFQGPIWAKSRACYDDPSPVDEMKDSYVIEGYVSSSKHKQREELARLLLKILEKNLSDFYTSPEVGPILIEDREQEVENETLPKENERKKEPVKAKKPASKKEEDKSESGGSLLKEYSQAYPLSFKLFKAVLLIVFLLVFFFYLLPFASDDLRRSSRVFTDQLQLFKQNN